jgi:beta-lactamase regulating signal transducer with metallopeptidase domain
MLVDLLINWAWQGCAVTLAAWGIVRVGRLSATAKYQIWWGALLLVLLLPAMPALLATLGPAPFGDAVPVAPVTEIPIPRLSPWPVLAALLVWAAGAAISIVRALRAHRALARMRGSSRTFPAAREQRLTNWIRLRATGRPARLVISDKVRAAAVLGPGSPVIAVSPAAERTLTDAELDRVLVHEWAHVQRRDDLAKLAQVLIRGLVWMHPAVRAIDRQLDIEREVACDDWVVNLTGGARDLARCLTRLAEIPCAIPAQPLAPAAIASTSLSIRVRRLLDTARSTTTRSPLPTLTALAGTLAVIALSISGVQLVGVASSTILPMPHRVATLAGSLNQQRAVFSPSGGERHVDTAPPPTPSDPSSASPVPRTRDARPVSARVTVEPLASLSSERRTTWMAPELPAPGTTAAAAAPVREVPAATGSAGDAADTPWGAATAAGLSVAHGSQRAADAAADAGTSIGRGSQRAATATAGFFTRFGRRVAGSF